MLRLEFTGATADELNEQAKDYVSKIKGTRGGKSAETETGQSGGQAPNPAMPQGGNPNAAAFNPGGGQQTTAFNPGGGAPQGGPFNPGGAPQLAPEVQNLVTRISTSMDGAIAKGQPAQSVLDWFRQEGVKAGIQEAASADLTQIKTLVLPKMPQPVLENIAKLMNA